MRIGRQYLLLVEKSQSQIENNIPLKLVLVKHLEARIGSKSIFAAEFSGTDILAPSAGKAPSQPFAFGAVCCCCDGIFLSVIVEPVIDMR